MNYDFTLLQGSDLLAPMPKQGHVQVQQALDVIKKALEESINETS